jgi:hypothetical protein
VPFLSNPWWNKGPAVIGNISILGSDFSIDSRDTTWHDSSGRMDLRDSSPVQFLGRRCG